MKDCRPHHWKRNNHNSENLSENILLIEIRDPAERQSAVFLVFFSKKSEFSTMAFDKIPHFEIAAVRVMGKLRCCWLHTDAKWSSNHFG